MVAYFFYRISDLDVFLFQYIKLILKINGILNKRPMGYIAHLRKQYKSINTYDYIITSIKRKKWQQINVVDKFEL